MKWKDKLKFLNGLPLSNLFFLFLFMFLSIIKEPWHDELYTKYLIHKSPIDIINELKRDSGPPFYYIIMHYLCLPFDFKILSIRIFSSIFIFFSGIMIYKILEKFSLKSIPLYFFYLMPLSIYYSTEARNYSLIIFLSSLFFFELLFNRRIIYLSIITILLLYTHNLCFIYLLFLFIFYLFQKDKSIILSFSISALFYIPIIIFIKNQPIESIYWISQNIELKNIINFFSNLGPNLFENYVYNFVPILPPLLFSLINFFIIIYQLKEKRFKPIVLFILSNLISIVFISKLYVNIYFPSRSEVFIIVPFTILIFSLFLKKTKISNVIFFFYLIILLFSSILMIISFSKPLKQREELSKILKVVKANTKIIVIGPWKLTTEYALEKENLKNIVETFPPSQNNHPGWYYYEKLKESDFNCFSLEISKSMTSLLVIWDKNNSIAKEIIEKLNIDLKIFSSTYFNFFIIN